MKIADIINSIKASQPKLFTKLNDTQAKQLASALFEEVGRLVDSGKDEPIMIAKLGRFRFKQIPSKTDPDKKIRRVILIRPKATASGKKVRPGK